jgi:hypothetical protein
MAVTWKKLAYFTDIPVKASGAELDTGTDDAKFATAKAIKDAHNVPSVAPSTSGNVLTSNGTDWISSTPAASASRWTALANFTATPASTSTITFGTDQTATLKVGMPVKYTISSVVYYGIITAMASNLMTVAGAPLGGDVTALSVGNPEMVVELSLFIGGAFAAATDTTAILNQLAARLIWTKGISHCVQYKINQTVADTGTENRVNVKLAGNSVGTANTNDGLDLDATVANWVTSVVDINTSNYTINLLDAIEILITKVGNGDASNLSVICVFVME